jgi:regulator of RNase E activity RraA
MEAEEMEVEMKSVIYEDFQRPDKALVERFANIPVADLSDCMNAPGGVDSAIRPVGRSGIVGPALTVKVSPGDNLMVNYAMHLLKEGDVLVIDGGGYGERALLGGVMITYILTKKPAGIIVDGAIRDTEEISKTGLPVYTRAITANGPYKEGPGQINTRITCGGQEVRPGDIVVADADSVCFVKPEEADEILQKAALLAEKQAASLREIHEQHTLTRPWVMEKLRAIGCTFHDWAEEV